MGILLVYDVTDEKSFSSTLPIPPHAGGRGRSRLERCIHNATLSDIRNWIRNIEQHATESVNKMLIGNKSDMVDKKVQPCFILKHPRPAPFKRVTA